MVSQSGGERMLGKSGYRHLKTVEKSTSHIHRLEIQSLWWYIGFCNHPQQSPDVDLTQPPAASHVLLVGEVQV